MRYKLLIERICEQVGGVIDSVVEIRTWLLLEAAPTSEVHKVLERLDGDLRIWLSALGGLAFLAYKGKSND